MEQIKARLSADLKSAMKERNEIAIKAIRSIMSAIDNAGAVAVNAPEAMPMAGRFAGATDGLRSTEVPRRELSEEEIRQIIRNEIDEMAKAIDSMKDFARPEIEELTERIKMLETYAEDRNL